MSRRPVSAIVTVAGDVEDLPLELAARGPSFDSGEIATIRAAVEDAGGALVTAPAKGDEGPRWRAFAREGDCLVSVVAVDLADVTRAVESVRALAREAAGESRR